MSPISLALVASVLFGVMVIFAKQGLRHIDSYTASSRSPSRLDKLVTQNRIRESENLYLGRFLGGELPGQTKEN